MSEYLIPDLFRIVLEYSNRSDREVWDFPEDIGPIYEELIYRDYISDKIIKQSINIIIKQYFALPDYILPTLLILRLRNTTYKDEIRLHHTPNLESLTITNKYKWSLHLQFVPKLKELQIINRPYTPIISYLYFDMSKLEANLPHNLMRPIELKHVPELQSLEIFCDYNHKLDLHLVPKLKELTLYTYTHYIDLSQLPLLTSLDFGTKYKHPINLEDVPNLELLALGNVYQQLDFTLVPKLTGLCIGSIFQSTLDLSPLHNLESLDTGDILNHPIDLHANLKLEMLEFGIEFNQHLDLYSNLLLKGLHLGDNFNHSLDLQTNLKLTELTIPYDYNQQILISPECDISTNKPEVLYCSIPYSI